ncbi:MAG: LolA family protein [Gemmataceae bacterium]
MTDFSDAELIHWLERLGNVRPAPDATRRALERVQRALAAPPSIPLQTRRKVMCKRLAAAVAVLLVAGSLFAWLWPSPASFAQVQAALKTTHSVTCRQTIQIEDKPDQVTRLWILDNGLWRAEESDGQYTVVDGAKHKTLAVHPKKHEALLLQGANVPRLNLYEKIKNLPGDTTARRLKGKKLDGKDVLGFAVKMSDQDFTVWADAATRLPVRIEAKGKNDDGKPSQLVIDEFIFDKELDPRLFSFAVPTGYKLAVKGVAELPAAPEDPRQKDLIVTPLAGIGPVKFGMSRADVEKALGKADAAEKQGKNGYVSLSYGSRGFFLGVSKTRGVVLISCQAQSVQLLRIRDFRGKTDKGIALGASLDDIVKAYGKPDRKETKQRMTYLSYSKLHASFTLAENKLVDMMFMKRKP